MNTEFFRKIEAGLASERLDAYRKDGVGPAVALARYLWNMAICEAMYSPLQIAEIALRNSIHSRLSERFCTDRWYDDMALFPSWQRKQVFNVREKLPSSGRVSMPGRIVAELHFGFWTGFFNKSHAGTGIGHALASQVFVFAPRRERNMKKLDIRLNRIRDLRNRVFHHERIIHWMDLDEQYACLLQTIGWINPPLYELANVLERYASIRKAGVQPWLDKLRHHWPHELAGE